MKRWLRSNEKAAYRMVNAALLTSMVLLGAEGFLGMGGRAPLLTALAMVAVFTCMNFTEARGRMFGAAVLLGLACAGMTIAGWEESFAFLGGFLPWLLGGRAGEGSEEAMPFGAVPVFTDTVPEAWIFGYGMLQAALIAAVCYAMEILLEKIPRLKRSFAAMICAVLLAAMALRWEISHLGVVFFLVWVVLVCGEWIQSRWEKVRREGNSREAHTLWIVPFVVLYLGLMAAMPVPEKPYDWIWAKNICNRIGDAFVTLTRNLKWGSREGFGVAFSGFSEDGTLGGDLRQNAEEAMWIWVQPGPERDGPEYLYLIGSAADTFDGRSWSRRRQGLSGEAFLDTAQTLNAVRHWNKKYQKDYLKEVVLDIRYEDFNTSFLFAPLKIWRLEGRDERAPEYISEGEELRWKKQKGYGTEYRVRYFMMNLGRQEVDFFLEQMSEQALMSEQRLMSGQSLMSGQALDGRLDRTLAQTEEDKDIWKDILQECKWHNGQEFTVEEIEAYKESVYRDYLGGAELSQEVAGCLKEMTEGAGTQIEKLRAIERGLAALSYTLTPGDLPEWVTDGGKFLDFFLLESRQGYCTYFATAFVLLARAEGIPARYVQGYCVPVQEGRTLVYSGMAHAWPEAYLEGVGWIPFEPTPGYGIRRYAPWEPAQPRDGGDGMLAGEMELPDQRGGGEEIGTTQAADSETSDAAKGPLEEPQPEENASEQGFFWKLSGLAVLTVLLAGAAFWILDGIVYRRRYRKMGPEERLRIQVLQNLEILRWFGLERKPWETLQEVAERAGQLPGLESTVPLMSLQSYENAIYGGKQVSEEDTRDAVREGEALLKLLKGRKRWAFFYCCLKMHR